MINAGFYISKQGKYIGFAVSGHADYGEYGQDIVCAAVSSAVQYVCNAVTDVFGIDASVEIAGNKIVLKTNSDDQNEIASNLIAALESHLRLLSNDYKNTIKIKKILR